MPVLARLALVALVVGFVGFGLRQAWTDSPTVDEGVDLASGLTHLVHRDLRMNPEHPALPKLLATAPALLADPIVPTDDAWRRGDWFDHTDATLAANDRAGRLRRVVFLSRLVPLAQAVLCGLVIALLARRLGGPRAGAVAAGLWFSTPFVLGIGHVQSLDVAFTLATLVVALALLRHREAPTTGRVAVVGLALAGALATRHTGVVLVPVALVALVVAPGGRARAVRAVATASAVALAGVWAVYRLVDPTAPGGAPGARFDGLIAAAGERSALARLALAVPLPTEWRAGFAYLTVTSDLRPAYLAGRAWEGTQWWYFPVSLVAKVPMPAVVLLVVGAVAWVWVPRSQRVAGAVCVVAPGVLLLGFTAVQPLALGLRLVLPCLALWMVVAGVGVDAVWERRGVRPLVAVVAVLQVLALVAGSAHSMAWSPPPFRPAHRWVSDANLDFGQDLHRVRAWADDHDRPWVAVVAPRGLEVGGDTRDLVEADPGEVTGWAAVGATALTVVSRDELAWLRAYCPVGTLGGGSTLLYRFDRPPSAEPGPTRPVAPCPDEPFSRRRSG